MIIFLCKKIMRWQNYFQLEKLEKFSFSRFISSTIAFGVLHTSLICCVLIQYFKDMGMLPMQLSAIIVSKRILRLFCDTFFGILFDRFGAKVVFITGRLLKLSSYFILLFCPNFIGFVVAMLIDGASYSSIYGKISSYIYNNLSVKRKLKLFPKAMSLYYLCMDATVAMMTFFAGILLRSYGYDVLIYISIISNVFSIILLVRFVPSGRSKHMQKYQSKSITDIFMTLKQVIKYRPAFLYLIGFYGIVSFLTWQFHSISSLVLLDMGVSSVNVAMCGALLKTFMGIGALFSFLFFSNKVYLLRYLVLLFAIIVFGFISMYFYNLYLFYLFCVFIVLSYTIMEVSIEKNFEFYSDKTIRGTAISLAMTFCSIIAILSNLLVGVLAQKYSYHTALCILMACFVCFVAFLLIKLIKTNDLRRDNI